MRNYLLHVTLPLKTQMTLIYFLFSVLPLHPTPLLHQSLPSSSNRVFDAFSSNIYKVLYFNPSANKFGGLASIVRTDQVLPFAPDKAKQFAEILYQTLISMTHSSLCAFPAAINLELLSITYTILTLVKVITAFDLCKRSEPGFRLVVVPIDYKQ